jgi:tryptophan synthase beta chain
VPEPIHAGGLRYHGASVLVSQLLRDNLVEASAIHQLECFEAGVLFTNTEGILPAPEATHGIAQVIREANRAKEEGVSKTILFNLCGHGYFDMSAYQDYFDGKLEDHELTEEELHSGLKELDTPTID